MTESVGNFSFAVTPMLGGTMAFLLTGKAKFLGSVVSYNISKISM